MYTNLDQFESTARKNVNLMLQAADKLKTGGLDMGSQLLNQPIRSINQKLVDSSLIPAFDAAQQIANNEMARVTSLGGNSGVLSDTARNEIMKINPKDITVKQAVDVANIMKGDMANRKTSMQKEIRTIARQPGGMDSFRDLGLDQKTDFTDRTEGTLNPDGSVNQGANPDKPVTPVRTGGKDVIPPPPPPVVISYKGQSKPYNPLTQGDLIKKILATPGAKLESGTVR
jgi:hypothetical protein